MELEAMLRCILLLSRLLLLQPLQTQCCWQPFLIPGSQDTSNLPEFKFTLHLILIMMAGVIADQRREYVSGTCGVSEGFSNREHPFEIGE